MREKKHHLYVDIQERTLLLHSLVELKNQLIQQGRSYSERRRMEIYVLSAPVIVDFYTLAVEYGRKQDFPDEENPYIKEAAEIVRRQPGFSYCLDWRLKGYTNPKRPFHSRILME